MRYTLYMARCFLKHLKDTQSYHRYSVKELEVLMNMHIGSLQGSGCKIWIY